jgi:hypothetical protein
MRQGLRLGMVVLCASAAAVTGASAGASRSVACSQAVGVQVMASHHMLDSGMKPRPTGEVLCGSFLGPGVPAMAVAAGSGTCLPFNGWAVFRYAGGTWQAVPGGAHYGYLVGLSRSGNDVVEKTVVPEPGKPICLAQGHRSRVWHWNGTRLVAGAWLGVQPAPTTTSGTLHLVYFLSPSHNLWCGVGDEDRFICSSANRPHIVILDRTGHSMICDPCTPNKQVFETGHPVAGSPVLQYGQTTEVGLYRCRSDQTGITCTVTSGSGKGRGFVINAAGVKLIGP